MLFGLLFYQFLETNAVRNKVQIFFYYISQFEFYFIISGYKINSVFRIWSKLFKSDIVFESKKIIQINQKIALSVIAFPNFFLYFKNLSTKPNLTMKMNISILILKKFDAIPEW